MALQTDLKVDELNFENIKANFISYLQAQDQFRDYNFDAAGIQVLLDMLAYNTYYNSFYLNMVANENFLATAQKRNSVVNLARSLNYIPRSTTSATIVGTAVLTVTGAPASDSNLLIHCKIIRTDCSHSPRRTRNRPYASAVSAVMTSN